MAKFFVKGSDPRLEVKPYAIYNKQNVSINKIQLEIWESFMQRVLAKCRHMCTNSAAPLQISAVPFLKLLN